MLVKKCYADKVSVVNEDFGGGLPALWLYFGKEFRCILSMP
jgi:hypothetical protein